MPGTLYPHVFFSTFSGTGVALAERQHEEV
jgi:hypothetical protein